MKEPISAIPWDSGEPLVLPLKEAEEVFQDALHARYRLPRPGTPLNAVRLPGTLVLNPTNTGTCPCSIFVASIDAAGHRLGFIELLPGESRPSYQAEPGSAFLVAASSAGCNFPDCFCELTITISVA
jgi:hypothetical protein